MITQYSGHDVEREWLRDNKRTLVLTGDVDALMAHMVISDLAIMGSNSTDRITFYINSPGGDAEFGLGIVDTILKVISEGIPVYGVVYGHAMSMALYVLQACEYRIIGSNSWLMYHGLTQCISADKEASEAHLCMMKDLTRDMAKLFAKRNTSPDPKYHKAGYWSRLAKSNTPNFYDANQALQLGLVDSVD